MEPIQSVLLPLSSLEPNSGQVEGMKSNPRTITKGEFSLLLKSIKETPEYLSINEVTVFPHGDKYIILNGNMRFEAVKKLGYAEIPCKVVPVDTPMEKINEYIVKANAHYGDWDWDKFANEWDNKRLKEWGVKMPVWDAEEKPKSKGKSNKITLTLDEGQTWELGEMSLSAGDKISLNEVQMILDNLRD